MSSPELLSHLGFRRKKLGASGKDVGYEIDGASLRRLLLMGAAAAALLGSLTAWSRFEIRLERRDLHRRLRGEEHDAAAKFAQVEMELWAHFREDLGESQEAILLMDSLSSSFDQLGARLQRSIGKMAQNFGLSQDKASILADATLGVMAEQRQESIRHARGLLGHLVRPPSEAPHNASLPAADGHQANASREPAALAPAGARRRGGLSVREQQLQELKDLVGRFWEAHESFQRAFASALGQLKEGDPVHDRLVELKTALKEGQLSDQEVSVVVGGAAGELGLSLGSGDLEFVKSTSDLLEVLLSLPRFPVRELAELDSRWRAGSADPYAVLRSLHTWRAEGRLPGLWLEHALALDGQGGGR